MHKFVSDALIQLKPILKKHWEIDHVCFRTDSLDDYEQTKEKFSESGTLLVESLVGGRPIATYKLHRPIWVDDYCIGLVEIPAPKEGKNTPHGFEHLEVVIDCTFDELINSFPLLKWDRRAINKELNPELEAQFDGFNVKFHYQSLEQVINLEKDERIQGFLNKYQFLKLFQDFSPFFTGTIPISIDLPNSDLDILFKSDNFTELRKRLERHFVDLNMEETLDYHLARTHYDDLPIEIYSTHTHPLYQNAHRHMRIEARLLKILGSNFRQRIMNERKSGVKTEPAFGKVLELSRPYEDLLELYFLSDKELLQRFISHCN